MQILEKTWAHVHTSGIAYAGNRTRNAEQETQTNLEEIKK